MDLFTLLNLDELSLGLSNLQMFPFFETAHYIISVMALREQPGVLEVAHRSPFACWYSSMLFCFGGAILSGLMLAEPPVAPLSNTTSVLLASLMWYLVFYSPQDLMYSCASIAPVRLVLAGMKEVTRTWKVLGGVVQAQKKYENGLLVMIAVGWAKGAGGGLISNFEQLVRGIWKPETNELLRMTYPTKITLIGAVLFALQQNHYLPLKKHHLMLIYTIFTVINKARMMLTGSSSSPFALMESAMYHMFFARPAAYSPLAEEGSQAQLHSSKTPSAHCDDPKSSVQPDADSSPSHESKLQKRNSTNAKKVDQEVGKDPKCDKKTD
ncbi:trimeric intracellular cation channel type B isoform X1 [Sardina pilchardus]|uniref:trimeric intracellular cation channel type B isoform X1 n=2 Tax=Sardina pilchardus TaxID=27697 RepID=UPI002E10DA30